MMFFETRVATGTIAAATVVSVDITFDFSPKSILNAQVAAYTTNEYSAVVHGFGSTNLDTSNDNVKILSITPGVNKVTVKLANASGANAMNYMLTVTAAFGG